MRKRTLLLGIISIVTFVISGIFTFMQLPGGRVLLIIGLSIFLFGFLLSFMIDKVTIESRKAARIVLILLFITIFLSFTYLIITVFQFPGVKLVGFISTLMTMIFFVFLTRQLEGRKLTIRANRQLASILFTDIVGYTSLMGENENRALEYLDFNRKVQKRLIRKHRGKFLKEMGDGLISIFFTASEATICALEIQKEINARELFQVRMGVHISEIVFTDSDVFGDGVNVTSRISDCAGPGEIILSESVFNNVRNREDIEIVPIGERALKNVAYELKLYKIVTLHTKDTIT